jgi:hypothetical protein
MHPPLLPDSSKVKKKVFKARKKKEARKQTYCNVSSRKVALLVVGL